mmetsp:Transcript_67380/g.119249  ORF Transcript_67380/g.119249 Transcript_67380/m.119249 type:complete len:103 (-) Transcript_67380:340-648(-)
MEEQVAGNPNVGKIPSGKYAGKNIFDKDVPGDEMIKGLLKMMPVGARTCTYLPADAVATLSKDETKDWSSLPGVQTFQDGPYLDDWSTVPPQIAAKYSTAPR